MEHLDFRREQVPRSKGVASSLVFRPGKIMSNENLNWVRDQVLRNSEHHEAKSKKHREVFKVKSRNKARQVREIWSQQLEHEQVPKGGTESSVRKGKRSLLACPARRKCSKETYLNSVVKLGTVIISV